MLAQYPRDSIFCLETWDPEGGDITWHHHPSGRKESLKESRGQVLQLMNQKADMKEVAFLHHCHGGVKAIIEKNHLGNMKPNGCSVYLWASKLDNIIPNGKQLGVIPSFGFVTCTFLVDREVVSVEDAVKRLSEKPSD